MRKNATTVTISEHLKIYYHAIVTQQRSRIGYNNPLASFATCLCSQREPTCVNCAAVLSVSGPSRSQLCPDGPRVHLSGPANMPSCVRPEVRLPLDQRVLCSDCRKKCSMSRPGSLLLFCTVQQQDTFLVHTTKFTNLRSLLFRQPDGVNCVVRRVYLAIIAKLSKNRVPVVQLMDCGC